jgi:hypothetical protein
MLGRGFRSNMKALYEEPHDKSKFVYLFIKIEHWILCNKNSEPKKHVKKLIEMLNNVQYLNKTDI